MWLKAVPSIVECSHHGFLLPPSPPPPLPLPPPLSSLSSNLFPRPKIISTTTRGRTIRRSCSSNIDGDIYHDDSPFNNVEQLPISGPTGPDSSTKADHHHHHHLQGGTISNNKRHCSLSKNNNNSPFTDDKHMKDRDSFLHSRFDFLEPMMLGIKPEFPDWSDRESVVIEQKAKSFDIPLSLRMIKKKLQLEDGLCRDSSDCSVKAAFASMVFIIVELQSHALHMREALCNEDLDVITSKVQKEMHSSFVWLFQQVFSKTPALMLQVMILLADFSVHSASNNIPPSTPSFNEDKQSQYYPLRIEEQTQVEKTSSYIVGDNHTNVKDLNLWSSMVEDASEMMREGDVEEELVLPKHFVAPLWVEIEPDDYEEFTRTDLLYQMNLSLQPDHPLLLCNYGQFLHRIAHDHDRAEECFKRAVQLSPGDAECLSRYADFLWIVRGEDTIAEEMFLEAMAIEPHNSYYYAMYARFLWRTGGDETCFPLNPNS